MLENRTAKRQICFVRKERGLVDEKAKFFPRARDATRVAISNPRLKRRAYIIQFCAKHAVDIVSLINRHYFLLTFPFHVHSSFCDRSEQSLLFSFSYLISQLSQAPIVYLCPTVSIAKRAIYFSLRFFDKKRKRCRVLRLIVSTLIFPLLSVGRVAL